MPLHEYLERKRRERIDALEESGACHICESTCRKRSGGAAHNDGVMRKCGCYGDDSGWKYSLRVCEHCVADDARIGRIRACGMCGAVACDEDCAVQLVECTEVEKWNNKGCLECRGMESFDEIELFRIANAEEDRCTRVCTDCLERATPWMKFDFKCRRFYCTARLVPSNVIEMKRKCKFEKSSMSILSEEVLSLILTYCTSRELIQAYQTCTTFCLAAERAAHEVVQKAQSMFPTGPLRESERGGMYAEGTNDRPLQVPDDGKAWVGLLYYLEKMAERSFYFGFQDFHFASRHLRQTGNMSFSRTSEITDPSQFKVLGGQVFFLPSRNDGRERAASRAFESICDKEMTSGKHRVLCRIFCPGSGRDSRHQERHGCIGLVRGDYDPNSKSGNEDRWYRRVNLWEGRKSDEIVVGLELDLDNGLLCAYHIDHFRFNGSAVVTRHPLPRGSQARSPLYWACELGPKSLENNYSQMSIRECSEPEWELFKSHHRVLRSDPTTSSRMYRMALGGMDGFEMLFDGELERHDQMELV